MNHIAFHETNTDSVSKILHEGITCRPYPSHPLGGLNKCLVFLYPPTYIRRALAYWPQNARLQGIENLDSLSILVVDITDMDGKIGELFWEGRPDKYLSSTVSYNDYIRTPYKYSFREGEIVISRSIPKDRILQAIVYSDFIKVFDSCMEKRDSLSCLKQIHHVEEGKMRLGYEPR